MIHKSSVRPVVVLALAILILVLGSGYAGAVTLRGAVTSRGASLECTERPATPELLSPANGAIVDPADTTLRWSEVADATGYRVQLCAAASCGAPLREISTSGNFYGLGAAAGLLPEGVCLYWRVRAENDCGVSDYSAAWEVCGAPEPPTSTPTNTLTPSITPTPSDTPTPTVTPMSRTVAGYVRDADSGAPLAGVTVTLYRTEGSGWFQVNQKTTNVNGYYAVTFSLVTTTYRLVQTDRPGYLSDRVTIPPGLGGTIIDPNTVQFALPGAALVEPVIYYDRLAPTETPTLTPTATDTPTETPTATEAATETPTPSPTATPRSGTVLWLPIIQNSYER